MTHLIIVFTHSTNNFITQYTETHEEQTELNNKKYREKKKKKTKQNTILITTAKTRRKRNIEILTEPFANAKPF